MRKFTSELNATKNMDYIEKCFKQKLHIIKFATKNFLNTYVSLSTPRVELGSSKDLRF